MKTNSNFRLCAFAFAALAAAACPALAEKVGYDHYKTIVDRQMFGPLPADFDPTKMPSEVAKSSSSASAAAEAQLTKEQEKLKSAVRFSVINVTPQGDVAVGFTDSSNAKTPKHYYLKRGEARDGWLVKEADPETATVTLEKDGIELPLAIGEDSAKKNPKKGAGVAKDQARGANPGRSSLLGSVGARRRSRKEEQAKQAADNAQLKRQLEEMKERQEQDRLEREQEEAQRNAEEEATREECRKELESLRQVISKNREKLTAPAPEEKAEEESNDENNDAE